MSQPMKGKLLAVDADGTLISNNQIAPRNNPALCRFTDDGGTVVLCSGRCVKGARQILSLCPILQVGLVCNGGVWYDFERQTILKQCDIDREERRFIQEVLRRFPHVGLEIPSGQEVYHTALSDEVVDHGKNEQLDPTVVSPEQVWDKVWNKVLFSPDDPSVLDTVIRLGEEWPLRRSYLVRTTASFSDRPRQYAEMVPKGVDKGNALLDFAQRHGFSQNDLYAIGDYYNDLPMLNVAGCAAVTAGAPDEMKRSADVVTGPCAQGAVADFIEYLYTNNL